MTAVSNQTPGRQARSWVRYLHTGEAPGIVGQTIAGIFSLTSVIMVWTGLALAYRRRQLNDKALGSDRPLRCCREAAGRS